MQSLYPRTISGYRSITVAGTTDAGGLVGYSGMTANPDPADSGKQGETVLFPGVPASIQATAAGRKKASTLPSDSVFAPTWVIYISLKALAKGSVRDRDI